MTDSQKKPIWKNELVWLFLITSGLFALLYSKFILGGFAYVFTDCGADTLQINYAQYEMFSSSVSYINILKSISRSFHVCFSACKITY